MSTVPIQKMYSFVNYGTATVTYVVGPYFKQDKECNTVVGVYGYEILK